MRSTKAVKALAYVKAPRTMFTLTHPLTALKLKSLSYVMRNSPAPRIAGVAAAAVAFPIGLLLGARLNGRDRD